MVKVDLFRKLIYILEEARIPYAIVGRTEGYPDNIGSDVDIVIPRSKINVFHKVIWAMESEDTKVVNLLQHEIVAFYYVVMSFRNGEINFIQPDVCTDYYRQGRKLLSADYLLEDIQVADQGGFNVLSPEKEFIYYLLKKVDKAKMSEEQYEHIRNSYLKNPEAAIAETVKFWKEKDVAILKRCLDSNDYSILSSNILTLRQGIHCSHHKDIIDVFRNLNLKIKRILNPTGLVIGVMGPDGSGKTTVMEQVKKDIAPAFRNIAQYHLFPKEMKETQKVNTDPHGQKRRGFISSILKLCYLLALYNSGWFRLVLPQKVRSTFVIFDRYYQDILVDPQRYRNGTPKWVTSLFGRFIPNPSLWIILDAPTEVIQARKQEVPFEETATQRKKYKEFALSCKNGIIVDTDRPVMEISYEVCRFLMGHLNIRTHKRYKI